LTLLLLLALPCAAQQLPNVSPDPGTAENNYYIESKLRAQKKTINNFTAQPGPQGAQGMQGIPGATGATGATGAAGAAATIAAGTAVALSSTSAPTVSNSGTTSAAVFNFGIPAGANGLSGINGTNGTNGSNGLLIFANPISTFLVVAATDWSVFYVLTVDLDGVVRVNTTSQTNTNVSLLSNAFFTSRITVDPSDMVWRMQQNTVSLRLSDRGIMDANRNVWDLGMDPDGVARTSWVGSL
jgi:hypothetical protein